MSVVDKIDFLVRFWELEARSANLGQPLASHEQIELLSLLQLVTTEPRMPEVGPAPEAKGAAPAQMSGDGTIAPCEIRKVTAAAIVIVADKAFGPGAGVIVRTADAVTGVEYTLPCRVAWVHPGARCTMALVVDGIPVRADFASPPMIATSLAMGRPVRLVG